MSPAMSSGGTKGMANSKKTSSPCVTPNHQIVYVSQRQLIKYDLPYSTVTLEENSIGKVEDEGDAGQLGASYYNDARNQLLAIL